MRDLAEFLNLSAAEVYYSPLADLKALRRQLRPWLATQANREREMRRVWAAVRDDLSPADAESAAHLLALAETTREAGSSFLASLDGLIRRRDAEAKSRQRNNRRAPSPAVSVAPVLVERQPPHSQETL